MIARTAVIACAAAMACSLTYASRTVPDALQPPCVAVNVADGSGGTAVVLIGLGWRGDPSDLAERLYSPDCQP